MLSSTIRWLPATSLYLVWQVDSLEEARQRILKIWAEPASEYIQ